ncbi:hypothetical protein ACHAW5_001201 [Stephanodiscus triporus]|uniref:Uncharacterized protein n=1 Tax=Stephanodiscus triporus TaxID=2934178 RepID=A0ABD3P127_9STRA
MDLLGDIGHADQLTSAREENNVLRAKVKELTIRIHQLCAENEALRAEAEMYREDCYASRGVGTSVDDSRRSGGGGGNEGGEGAPPPTTEDFVTSGNGMYPSDPVATLPDVHGSSNPLCCALHPADDSLLATGGADSCLRLCRWGTALSPGGGSPARAVRESISVPCGAPVICCAFAPPRVVDGGGRGGRRGGPSAAASVVAAGCMDGSVKLAYCGAAGSDAPPAAVGGDRLLKSRESSGDDVDDDSVVIRHKRYVKTICWSPAEPVLASASADGTIRLTRIGDVDVETMTASIEVFKSIHLDGPVESMCYLNDGETLCCYVRGTSYLSYFDLKDGYRLKRASLNGGTVGTGGFDEHVSFAVLSLSPCPRGRYIALATDTSRNIIMEAGTERIVRNLYGHKNDGYSNPKISWSKNGQYLYGNSQDENCIYVWDIASSSIVKRLDEGYGGHGGFVRDIYSSANTDTVASVSFDRTAKIWLSDRASLNGGTVGTGGFDEHVSFAVLSLSPCPRGRYIALATDTSRNIIMEAGTERIVRNLYGHKNDGYSNPKISWSKNGQYLYGNSQDENCIYVWDIASSSIVKRLDEGYGGHGGFVRDIYSSANTDTVASVSFDRTAKIWLSDV